MSFIIHIMSPCSGQMILGCAFNLAFSSSEDFTTFCLWIPQLFFWTLDFVLAEQKKSETEGSSGWPMPQGACRKQPALNSHTQRERERERLTFFSVWRASGIQQLRHASHFSACISLSPSLTHSSLCPLGIGQKRRFSPLPPPASSFFLSTILSPPPPSRSVIYQQPLLSPVNLLFPTRFLWRWKTTLGLTLASTLYYFRLYFRIGRCPGATCKMTSAFYL